MIRLAPALPGAAASAALLAVLASVPASAQLSPEAQARIDALAADPAVAGALDRIEALDPWTLDLTIELTEIPAPPFMEEERAARFAELLRELGADSVWIDEEGNAVGLRRGTTGARTIAVGGHLDTVFPEGTDVTVEIRGDTLFAPGVGDDSRGLAMVLTLLRTLEEEGIETEDDLLFVGTVGEEGLGDLRGIKYLFRDGADPIDAWIEIDGGGIGNTVSMGLGSVRYRAMFEGEGGHSWGAFGLANPAHALANAIVEFQREADAFTRSGPRTSYNVGRIGGGTSVNSIPFEAWAEVDMRSIDPASLAEIERIFLAAMERGAARENELAREGTPVRANPIKIGDRPSGEMDPNHPLVQHAMATAAWAGETPTLGRSSTNSNTPIAAGVPAVTIGRGGIGANGHALDEYWVNRDAHLAIQRGLLLVLATAGLAG